MTTIRDAITKYSKLLEGKTESEKTELHSKLDIDIRELAIYQERKSLAMLENRIDFETAQYLYQKLNHWSSTTLTERIVLTQVFANILKITL